MRRRRPASPVERIDILFELDMHYVGQTHTVAVPLPVAVQTGTTRRQRGHDPRGVRGAPIAASFSRLLPGIADPRSSSCASRRSAAGRSSILRRSRRMPRASLEKARRGARPVWFDGGWHDTRDLVAARPAGRRGRSQGPAILEQPDATIFIEPGPRGARRRARQRRSWSAA